MRALIFEHELRLVDDRPLPRPAAGEALIRVTLAGICNTDLEITKGYMGFQGVLGHEFVGVVERAPEGRLIGRRVVGEINCPCGACRHCRSGLGNHCRQRTVLGIAGRDGAFAEYLSLPVANLHPVPDAVPDEEAVFAEPLAAALEVPAQVHVRPGDEAVVIGDGKLGLLVAQVLALGGCAVTLVGRHPAKLALAEGWGIETAQAGRELPEGADLVVEASGRPEGMALAKRLVRPRGTIVLKSTYAAGAPATPVGDVQLVIDEVTVVGSRCGPFAAALRLLARRRVDVRSLITARYPLGEGIAAFERAKERDVLKVILHCLHAG